MEEEKYKPSLEDWHPGSPFYQFAKNYCYKNKWRVQYLLGGDLDDCIAQCALWWVECNKFYEGKINSPAHMMFLYRLWITGQFHDLASRDTKRREVVQYRKEPTTTSEGELSVKLGEASTELKQVLNIMFNAPQEIIETLRIDCQSYNPKQYFKKVISHLKINPAKTPELVKELQDLLS